jgi:branched-chain amino acid transport system substrate-binding protein
MSGDEKMAVASYMSQIGLPQLNTTTCASAVFALPWAFAGGGSDDQYASAAGKYAWDGMHYKTLTILSSDVSFARDAVMIPFKAAFEAEGGQVIQEQYAPFPCSDFASFLANLKPADALAAWLMGPDAILFLNQVNQMNIRQKMPVYAAYFGAFMAPFLLSAMPPAAADACIGEITATPYAPSIDTDINKKFVAEYEAKFSQVPDDSAASPYDTALALLSALKATGGDTTPEKLKQAILGVDLQGVEGHIKFDAATKCSFKDIYVCKIGKVNGQYTWIPVYTYKDVPPAGFAPAPSP